MTIQSESEEKKILQLIVSASEEFLQSAGTELNYQKITDNILYISGAKYAAFDLYDEDGSKFRTLALSGPEAIAKKISSLIGFNLLGKVWENKPVRADKIKSYAMIHVTTVSEYAGDLVAKPIAFLVEKALNLGKLVIVKILKDNLMIGNFILAMPKNVDFRNGNYIELYTRQLGLLITRSRSEARLRESEIQLKSIFSAVSDPIFLLDQKTGAILDANIAASSLYGYSRDEMLTLKATDMSAELDKTNKAMKDPLNLIPVRHHKKKDGTVFIVEITSSLFELNGRNVLATSMRDITERKKGEENLKNKTEALQNVIAGTNAGTYEWNVQTGDNVFNEKMVEMVGYSLKELELTGTKSLERLWHPGDLAKSEELLQKHFQGISEYYYMESRIRHKNGSWVWIADRGKVIEWDNAGKPLKMFGTCVDISELKKAEIALRESEEKYRTLFDASVEGILIAEIKTQKFKYANPAICQMFGYTQEELRTLSISDIHPKDAAKGIQAKFQDQVLGKCSLITDIPCLRKDGTIFYSDINAAVATIDGLKCTVGLFHDITERKLSEEILQASEERYRIISDQSPIAIERYNELGGLLDVNPACLKLFGVSDIKEIQNFDLFADPNISDENRKILKQGKAVHYQGLFDFEKVKELKLYHTSKSGSIWLDVIITPLKDTTDTINGYLLHIIDITERKKAEEEILHLSFHDHLTGLYNRRFFEEELKRLDTERQLPLSFIMGDLNSLKIINDVFGHNKGDDLLQEVGKILTSVCRCDDILARWGGDEFVILLPKTSASDTEEIVERIKKECAKTSSQKIPVSLSIGAATKETAGQAIQLTVIDAESNMYKNKLAQKESLTSSIIFALEQALYEKSTETKEHTDRIQELARKLGKEINLSSHQLDELSLLASLHDIGKVAIPETILLKKGKLTEKEWSIIKRHPEIGFNIAQSSPQIAHIAKSILSCHENFDGSGYPLGLKGQAIPVISRIILIVDAYDVMTSGRAYKPAMSKEDAIMELKRCAGTQFDPELVDKTIEILSK